MRTRDRKYMPREHWGSFDSLAPRVRRALTDTAIEMRAGDFAGMDENKALSYILDIDHEVRAADAQEKRR